MPPTICSEKKRQTRVDLRNNSRRSLQNSELSGNLNHDTTTTAATTTTSATTPLNMHSTQMPLRFNELGHHHLHKSVSAEVNSNYRQLVVDMSDNAVTSTTSPLSGVSHSDAESSDAAECRLQNRDTVSNDSSYFTHHHHHHHNGHSDSNNSNSNRESTSSLIGDKRQHHVYCMSENNDDYQEGDDIDYDDDVDDADDAEEESEMFTSYDNTPDDSRKSMGMMDYETVSMTSLDTEKSAKLKRGNQPLLRDKIMATKHHKGMKCMASNVRNTEGLLSIAIKTIKLVKRNQLLQQRLTQLQMETTEFIQSVLANPENSHFRTKISPQNVRKVGNV